MPPTLAGMNHRLTQRRCPHQEVISLMTWGFINPTRESRWLSQFESPRPPFGWAANLPACGCHEWTENHGQGTVSQGEIPNFKIIHHSDHQPGSGWERWCVSEHSDIQWPNCLRGVCRPRREEEARLLKTLFDFEEAIPTLGCRWMKRSTIRPSNTLTTSALLSRFCNKKHTIIKL